MLPHLLVDKVWDSDCVRAVLRYVPKKEAWLAKRCKIEKCHMLRIELELNETRPDLTSEPRIANVLLSVKYTSLLAWNTADGKKTVLVSTLLSANCVTITHNGMSRIFWWPSYVWLSSSRYWFSSKVSSGLLAFTTVVLDEKRNAFRLIAFYFVVRVVVQKVSTVVWKNQCPYIYHDTTWHGKEQRNMVTERLVSTSCRYPHRNKRHRDSSRLRVRQHRFIRSRPTSNFPIEHICTYPTRLNGW